MVRERMTDGDSLTAARLATAVALATSIQAEGFDELLDRFRQAYDVVVDVTEETDEAASDIIVRLPHVDAPEIPEPPRPKQPTFERR